MLFKFVPRKALCTLACLLWRIPRGVPSVASHISCLLCRISLGPDDCCGAHPHGGGLHFITSFCICKSPPSGEAEQDNPTAVVGVEVRTVPLTAEPWVRSHGVIDGGFEVMRASWPKPDHVFSVRRSDEEEIEGERSPKPSKRGPRMLSHGPKGRRARV
jgi:hypothetical protein